jgi:actin-related protein
VDTRAELAQNIVLTGGMVRTKGFKKRLKTDLVSLLETPDFVELKGLQKDIHIPKIEYSSTSLFWVGASIVSKLDWANTNALKPKETL